MKRVLHLGVLLCLVPGACSGPPAVETPAAATSAQPARPSPQRWVAPPKS